MTQKLCYSVGKTAIFSLVGVGLIMQTLTL
jgi:hypothetical protein